MRNRLCFLFAWSWLCLASGCASPMLAKHPYGFAPEMERTPGEPEMTIVMPANAPSISQQYRSFRRPPGAENPYEHDGIDIIAPAGTPVLAAASGRVLRSHYTLIRGHRIVVEHGRDGSGRFARTEYAHLRERLVQEGQNVERGRRIGTLGRSGLTAGFPHLHFRVAVSEKSGSTDYINSVNPHLAWADGPGAVTCFDPDRRWPKSAPVMTYPLPCR